MDMNREQMLKEVMAADFTLIDLNLYLNTHPADLRAAMLQCAAMQKAHMVTDAYEKAYGPLSHMSKYNTGCPYPWINPPWPWQKMC